MIAYFATIIVAVLIFVFTTVTSGGTLRSYLDIPSIFIMLLFPFVYQWLIFGAKTVKTAFTAGFNKNASLEEIKKALLFFKTYTKTIWISAMLAFLIGFIAILFHLEDRRALGPNLALASISLFYAGFIQILIIIPNSVFLKKRLLTFTDE